MVEKGVVKGDGKVDIRGVFLPLMRKGRSIYSLVKKEMRKIMKQVKFILHIMEGESNMCKF